MLEIEIKSKCNSLSEFEKKIISFGANFKETIDEEDIYFNHPSKDYRETGEAFRIRRMNHKYCVTYKGPKLSTKAKTRYEIETGIENYSDFKTLLVKLGFVEAGIVKKKRTIYEYNSIEICLDDVKNLGQFVELEKLGDDNSTIENELFKLAEELGLNQFISRSYLSMLQNQ